jgi:sugar phosphate isomerase/epimerase
MLTKPWTRRQLLATSLVAGAAVAIPARSASFLGSGGPELGVQLYPFSADVAKDMDTTFARLAAMGYRLVETSGFHGKRPRDLKAAAEHAGLTMTSAHIQAQLRMAATDRVLTDKDIGALAHDLQELGVQHVVMPLMLMPDAASANIREKGMAGFIEAVSRFSTADWQRNADFLNQTGERLRREGLALSYHNHNMEFAPLGDTCGYDILMRETDATVVGMELDIGWAAAAGRDPMTLMHQYAGRIRMLHVKDVSSATKPNFVGQQISSPLGKGVVDWAALFSLARSQGIKGYFVEQEPPFATSAFDAMAQSIAYLKNLP